MSSTAGGTPSAGSEAGAMAHPAAADLAQLFSNCRGWRWCVDCRRWVPGGSAGWSVHLACYLHKDNLSHSEGMRARWPGIQLEEIRTPDYSVVAVVSEGSRQGAVTGDHLRDVEHEVTLTAAQALLLQQALRLEVPNHCTSEEYAQIRHQVEVDRLVHLQHDWGIRGRYRSKNELVIPAHQSLALLPVAVAALPPVLCLCITVGRMDGWEPIISAAIVLFGSALPFLQQLRVTIWWHVDDLRMTERVTSRFLQFAAAALASSHTYFLRQIVIRVGSDDAQERLQEARDLFAAKMAAAARSRRHALLMGTHCRAAAAGCLLRRLPSALLAVIMTDSLPLAPCACIILGPEMQRPRQ